jgi:hypothetical protein
VETAIAFIKECGMYLVEVSPRGVHGVPCLPGHHLLRSSMTLAVKLCVAASL